MGSLVFESETLNFGKIPVWQEEPIPQKIKCRNTGRKTLRIRRVDSNCSCYSVTQYPRQLAPGEVGTFTLTADPARATPKASIHVVTDIPRQPDVFFAVIAEPVPYAEFAPSVCDFGEIHTNTVHEKVVKLHINAPIDKSAIALLPTNEDQISGKLAFCHSSGIDLKIHLGPLLEQKFFSTLLTCVLPGDRTLSLPVTANVTSRVKVTPEFLFYKQTEKGKRPILSFTLHSDSPFRVLKIDSPSAIKVQFRKISYSGQTNELTVQVHLSPKEIEPALRQGIRVFTDVEQAPIRIPVYVINAKGINLLPAVESGE